MKPLVVQVDPEPLVVDLLDTMIPEPVGVGAPPDGWNVDTSNPWVGVFLDGTPISTPFVSQAASIRVTVFAKDTGTAKDAALFAQGQLLAHPGGAGVVSVQHLTGLLVAFDRVLKAEMATFTVRVTTRTLPL